MRKTSLKIGLVGSAFLLTTLSSSVAFGLPQQANAHAQAANNGASNAKDSQTASSTAVQNQTTSDTHGQAGKLKACQNREAAINKIMTNIDTRAQNQLSLFTTIADRVETFYTTSGKTVTNYSQLVGAIDTAKTTAETDLGTLQTNSTFSCSSSDPKGMVTSFQSYLKTEISDLQSYRTAVKNLIVAVAKANSVTVNDGTGSTTQGGQ